jgi:ribonuclease Z
LKSFDLRDRSMPLTVFGPPGTEALLDAMRRTVFGRLKYRFKAVDLEPDAIVEFDGYEVHALRVRHRGEAYGYALIEEGRPGRFDAELAQRLGVTPGPDFGRLQRGEDVATAAGRTVRPSEVLGPPRAGRTVVVTGDTEPCEPVLDAARGASVLVHEATFLDDERDRARETRHSTAREAAALARDADVGLLVLTHLSSRHAPREVREEAEREFPRVLVPRDFDQVQVPFPERGEPIVHPARGRRGAAPDAPSEAPATVAPIDL